MIKVRRLFKSFTYALHGLIKTFHEEQNLQIQSVAGLITILVGIFFQISRWEWMLLLFIIGLVILMELINSAVERITDVLKPRIDSYVKEIKDIMAAAVMLASVLSIIIGLAIFYPYIVKLIIS